MFTTEVLKQYSKNQARVCRFTTAHGSVTTPCFMPVATRAYVNHATIDDLIQAGSQIILGGNTYHMLVKPGMDIIETLGGMHNMMAWQKPMLTDSGGFQVFSLSKNEKLCKIDEKGARFKHPNSGKTIHLNPQSSIESQKIIGADIIMAFDQCTPVDASYDDTISAMNRTHRWLLESIEHHQQAVNTPYGYPQALFGIIQGGSFQDLRLQSAEFILQQPLDGIAIGGAVIGYDMAKTIEILQWLADVLPQDKIHYTMGVGLYPQDLIDVVAQGVDIFDCVAPTRNARHGTLYHGQVVDTGDWLKFESEYERSRILIKKGQYATDQRPIMDNCPCYTCQHHTRAYLHYLMKEGSMSYCHLASIHNITVMHMVCEKMREKILNSAE